MSDPKSLCSPACWEMPVCAVCGRRKKPRGRSAPLEMANGLCDHECEGYDREPKAGHHWPGERCDAACYLDPEDADDD